MARRDSESSAFSQRLQILHKMALTGPGVGFTNQINNKIDFCFFNKKITSFVKSNFFLHLCFVSQNKPFHHSWKEYRRVMQIFVNTIRRKETIPLILEALKILHSTNQFLVWPDLKGPIWRPLYTGNILRKKNNSCCTRTPPLLFTCICYGYSSYFSFIVPN